MHWVLPPVRGSSAPEDSYQELVSDPRVKHAELNQKAVHYTKTCHRGGYPCRPNRKLKDKQIKLWLVSSDRVYINSINTKR